MSFAFSVLHIKATVLLHVCLNNEMLVCLFLNLKAILLNVLKPRLLGNIINLKVFFHHDKLQQASRAVLKGGGGGVDRDGRSALSGCPSCIWDKHLPDKQQASTCCV